MSAEERSPSGVASEWGYSGRTAKNFSPREFICFEEASDEGIVSRDPNRALISKPKFERIERKKRKRESEERGRARERERAEGANGKCLKVCAEANTMPFNPFIYEQKEK